MSGPCVVCGGASPTRECCACESPMCDSLACLTRGEDQDVWCNGCWDNGIRYSVADDGPLDMQLSELKDQLEQAENEKLHLEDQVDRVNEEINSYTEKIESVTRLLGNVTAGKREGMPVTPLDARPVFGRYKEAS